MPQQAFRDFNSQSSLLPTGPSLCSPPRPIGARRRGPAGWDWRSNLPLRSLRIKLDESRALRLLAAASKEEALGDSSLWCNHAGRFERLGRLLKPPRGGRQAGASSADPLRVGGNRGTRSSAYTDSGSKGRLRGVAKLHRLPPPLFAKGTPSFGREEAGAFAHPLEFPRTFFFP